MKRGPQTNLKGRAQIQEQRRAEGELSGLHPHGILNIDYDQPFHEVTPMRFLGLTSTLVVGGLLILAGLGYWLWDKLTYF